MSEQKKAPFEECARLLDQLADTHSLSREEYALLVRSASPELASYAAQKAVPLRRQWYGTDVYLRGLIEISSYCRNDCFYCGIRRGNTSCERYRLTPGQILDCCERGFALGFRTFVLQGGEDAFYTDAILCELIRSVKERCPGCAVTLSLGERSRESYEQLFAAGADRYLLRHETADPVHYAKLHPPVQTLENRMRCLRDLREIGYQVGCGFMVGSPYQTDDCLAADLKFIEEFQPDMCGIGPFIPHHATPFAQCPAGSVEQTLFLLSVIRLICPHILLPATTALGTLSSDGRERGILAGANVIMPNLSPEEDRGKYELYDNKLYTGAEAAEHRRRLEERLQAIGYTAVTARGDVRYSKMENENLKGKNI